MSSNHQIRAIRFYIHTYPAQVTLTHLYLHFSMFNSLRGYHRNVENALFIPSIKHQSIQMPPFITSACSLRISFVLVTRQSFVIRRLMSFCSHETSRTVRRFRQSQGRRQRSSIQVRWVDLGSSGYRPLMRKDILRRQPT